MAVIVKLPTLMAEKQKRENRFVTVTMVAEESGISRQTLYSLLDNEDPIKQIRLETIDALCRYFGCSVDDLLELHPPVGSPPL